MKIVKCCYLCTRVVSPEVKTMVTMTQLNSSAETTKERHFLVCILFYALGVVTVIPSNFFTTASDYWMYKFREIGSNASYDNANKTSLQAEFTADYVIVSNVSLVAFIVATSFLKGRVNIVRRIIGSLSGTVLLLTLTCIFVEVNTDSWQKGFFVFMLVIGFILTGMCGVLLATLLELAVKFPTSHLPTMFSGHAICGIFAALTQIFALGLGRGAQTTGLVYFLIGMLFIFLSLVGFVVAWKKLHFFRHHLMKEPEPTTPLEFNKKVILSAINKVKFYTISMAVVLGSTVMLYPGVITLVISVDKGNGNPWNETYFGPVINFLFYHLVDFVGREAAMYFRKPISGLTVLILSCARVSLVPLILFCNVTPRHHSSTLFNADYAYIIFLLIFAFSNGYLFNISIATVPEVTDKKETPFAMFCVLILVVFSLALSSATSAALVKAI